MFFLSGLTGQSAVRLLNHKFSLKTMDIIEKVRKEGFRRRLSSQTINSYVMNIRHFLNHSHDRITKKDISDYMDYLSERNFSGSSMNVALSSLKFMMQVIRKNWNIRIKFSRKPRKIPVFLTKQEIKQMLYSIENKKHYLVVALLYSAGLRVSELTGLKVKDLSIAEGYGFVRSGKGNKDRVFIIAKSLRDELVTWVYDMKPEEYLFTARSEQLSRKTVYSIVKYYARLSGIKKNVHPHTLRHSFATHLIENSYQLEQVQNVLGHESPETTQIYIHAALPRFNIESPLDTIRERQAAYS